MSVHLFFIAGAWAQSKKDKPDTFYVHFATGSAHVDAAGKTKLENLVKNNTLAKAEQINITGYADHRGSKGMNDTLSLRRARAVAGILIHAGLDEKNITLCAGMGAIYRDGGSDEELQPDRKVMIMRWTGKRASGDSFFSNPEKIKVDATYRLNVFFEFGSVTLTTESLPELEALYNFLDKYRAIKIRLEGHLCCPGYADDFYAAQSSKARAQAVYKYLVDRGIDSTRLKCVGWGNKKPVVSPEVTEEDKQKNRRVEMRILSK